MFGISIGEIALVATLAVILVKPSDLPQLMNIANALYKQFTDICNQFHDLCQQTAESLLQVSQNTYHTTSSTTQQATTTTPKQTTQSHVPNTE